MKEKEEWKDKNNLNQIGYLNVGEEVTADDWRNTAGPDMWRMTLDGSGQ